MFTDGAGEEVTIVLAVLLEGANMVCHDVSRNWSNEDLTFDRKMRRKVKRFVWGHDHICSVVSCMVTYGHDHMFIWLTLREKRILVLAGRSCDTRNPVAPVDLCMRSSIRVWLCAVGQIFGAASRGPSCVLVLLQLSRHSHRSR